MLSAAIIRVPVDLYDVRLHQCFAKMQVVCEQCPKAASQEAEERHKQLNERLIGQIRVHNLAHGRGGLKFTAVESAERQWNPARTTAQICDRQNVCRQRASGIAI